MKRNKITKVLKNYGPYLKSASAESCISAFENLLTIHKVDFEKLPELDAMQVIRWGFPLTYIDKSCLSQPLFETIVKSILMGGFPPPDKFAEIQAISLLFALGATSGNKIPTYNDKVHDFDLKWSDETVEIEVTKASTKDAHTSRTDQATTICEEVFSKIRSFDIHLYLADILSDSSRNKLLISASNIECGQTISEKNKWHIQGIPIERDVYELYRVEKNESKPSWWPKDVANLFTLKQFGAGPESKSAPPQVRVNYAVPLTGYLNPAKKKAKNFQGTRKNPFVILLEANNLPNAISAFNSGIIDLLGKWPHVSGIIVFFDYFAHKEIGWEFKLFVNQNAKRSLPKGLIHKIGKQEQNMRLVKKS